MTIRVPVVAGEQRAWNRRAADAINRVINGTAANESAIAAIDAAMPHSAPATKAANFTVGDDERWLINDKSGSACVVTLPAAADRPGRALTIKTIQAQAVTSGSANVVPLAGGAAGTAIVSGTAGRWATLVSDGSHWVIMAAG